MKPDDLEPFPPPDHDVLDKFEAVCPRGPGVERRVEHDGPAVFVDGHHVGGVHGEHMYVRLPLPELQLFLSLPGAGPFAPHGLLLPEFGVFPADMSLGERREWFDRAVAYVRTLVPA